MNLRKKRTIRICRRFDDQYEIGRDELHESIADVAGPTLVDDYEQLVLDRMEYAASPVSYAVVMPEEAACELAAKHDPPGPDAPAIDWKDYLDLSREEKVDGLRIELARRALSRNGDASATVSKVMWHLRRQGF